MDTAQACIELLKLYTDGDNVWAMRNDTLLASQSIGQDVDGPAVALRCAAVEVVREALEAVKVETVIS